MIGAIPVILQPGDKESKIVHALRLRWIALLFLMSFIAELTNRGVCERMYAEDGC